MLGSALVRAHHKLDGLLSWPWRRWQQLASSPNLLPACGEPAGRVVADALPLFALIGSIVGAIGGAAVGLPVPVLGSAVASIAGGALGALAGAAFAEHTRGESPSQSLRVGCAAFWGRLLGTGVKTIVATALVVGGTRGIDDLNKIPHHSGERDSDTYRD